MFRISNRMLLLGNLFEYAWNADNVDRLQRRREINRMAFLGLLDAAQSRRFDISISRSYPLNLRIVCSIFCSRSFKTNYLFKRFSWKRALQFSLRTAHEGLVTEHPTIN